MVRYFGLVCIVPTRFYSAEVDRDLWLHDPKSIGFLLSSSTTYTMKFESDWAKTVVCIVPTRFYRQGASLTFDPVTQNWYRVPPLIMNNLHVKFESDRAKTVVFIVPTRQSMMDRCTDGCTPSPNHTRTAAFIYLLYPLQRFCERIIMYIMYMLRLQTFKLCNEIQIRLQM